MKKLFLFAFAAFALAACSDDDSTFTPPVTPPVIPPVEQPDDEVDPIIHTQTYSFEWAEGLKDIEGQAVLLGDATVTGGSAAGVYTNVFWAKDITNFSNYLVNNTYDGYLFSSSDENVWFGTHFSTSTYGDYWGGFVMTGDYGKTTDAKGYNQFTVWADSGANATATCLIGYDDAFTFEFGGGTYARPTIEFAKRPRTVCHCYLANTAIAYTYAPTVVEPGKYYYKVVIVGSFNDVETGRVECMLIDGVNKVADWKKVDLTSLGRVDKLTFIAESNEANEYGLLAPAYFALDEIGFVADK